MKFSIKDFFGKYEQICVFIRISSHLLQKSLMENFIFCAVYRFWIGYLRAVVCFLMLLVFVTDNNLKIILKGFIKVPYWFLLEPLSTLVRGTLSRYKS